VTAARWSRKPRIRVKRSAREGRWADISSVRVRFALEIVFLILVAVGAALAQLGPLAIVGCILVASLLVALVERASHREHARKVTAEERSRAARLEPAAERPPAPAKEWNLWDLERRARERAGGAPRDEEQSALFVNLREFATAEGVLPQEFDALVRESFADLIHAA